MRAALAALLLAIALAVGNPAPAATGRATAVHYFQAFKGGRIAAGIQIEQTKPGYCWETSALESRPYTWRCFRGNYIEDPCFSAGRHSRYVLCPAAPWEKRVLRLRLTKPLPSWQKYRIDASLPVGVWTATGKRCRGFSGATSDIEGKPVRYTCERGGVLVGPANRKTATWTIYYAKGWRSNTLTRVGITDAWW